MIKKMITDQQLNNRNTYRVIRLFIFLFLFLIIPILSVSAQQNHESAVIYFNEACGMCGDYLSQVKDKLGEYGINNIVVKDYVNFPEYRTELLKINKKNNIPPSLQGHLVTIVDDKYFFQGHVPLYLVDEVLSNNYQEKILIYQDTMDEAGAVDFKIWAFKGEPKTYQKGSKALEYLNWFEKNKDSLPDINSESEYQMVNLLPVIITTGLLAGIHPCTIAVLLFFLAFMFTIQASKTKIFKIGLSYIIGIFIAYSAIGLGIFKAVVFTTPHFAAKIAGVLVLILGIFNLYAFFFKTGISFGIPKTSKKKIAELVQRSSIPASFILGIFVGACSFGCTAGIYFSILGLVSTQAAKGLFYLMIYNLMFIIPLIIILLISSNKKVVNKLQDLQRKDVKYIKLIGGIIMVLIGLYLLVPNLGMII